MPLMVDPSSGSLIGGGSPSLVTYAPDSSAATTIAPFPPTAIAVATVAAASASSTGLNSTQIVAKQAATQAANDASTPRYLMLAFGCLLILCLVLTHARFLARLLASSKGSSQSSKRRFPSTVDRRDAFTTLDDEPKRKVGGGGLWDGWYLRASPQSHSNPFTDPSESTLVRPHLYPPPHLTPILHYFPYASKLLFSSPLAILPGPFKSFVTLPALYLITAYLIIIIFALIWKVDLTAATKTKGTGADFTRAAFVGLTQLPVVVALGVRGSIIGQAVGKGYERLKVFHKVVGRVIFVCLTMHMAFFIHKWVVAGIFKTYFSKSFVLCGFVAWCSVVLVIVSSLPFIRKKWYALFEVCHFVGMIGMLVGISFHVDVAVPFTLSALFIYIISLIFSLTKTRLSRAELRALPGAGTTLITIPSLQSGWRAGQHVRIRIPALGPLKGLQSHPFTIASAPGSHGITLLCKKAGNWTDKLFELAQRQGDYATGSESGSRATTTILVEGPYGGLGNTLLPSFSSIMLIAGGSGLSHSLGIAHDLIEKSPTGVVRARTIELVWIVKTPENARPMMETLLGLVADAKENEQRALAALRRSENVAPPVGLRIKVYLTRCPASSPIDLLPPDPFGSALDNLNEKEEGVVFDVGIEENAENPFDDDAIQIDFSKSRSGPLKRQLSASEKEKQAYLARNPSARRVAPINTTIPALSFSNPVSAASSSSDRNQPQSELTVHTSRPDFGVMLDENMEKVIQRSRKNKIDPCGICVLPCGPFGMIKGVRDAVKRVDGWKRKAVGGLEIEEEAFGF